MSVSDWSANADENTSIDGISIAEHCPAKNMNDALRAVMAALKNKCDTLDDTDNTLRRGAVIGEIRWFAMSTPPEGWLVCNGASVFTSDYAALFAAIGKTFTPRLISTDPDVKNPEYSDPTVFLLPNLMNKVPWGSTQIGTEMKAGLPNIVGELSAGSGPGNGTGNCLLRNDVTAGAFYFKEESRGDTWPSSWAVPQLGGSFYRGVNFSASKSNPIYGKSDTVQPPALCLLPCIRYE